MLGQNTKHLAIIALVLSLAMAASAANVDWTGANADANGLGYWDSAGNWSTDALPTSGDKAKIESKNDTVVVDDYDPNTLKECDVLVMSWGNWGQNETLWLRSYDGTGPGPVFNCRLVQMSSKGGINSRIVIDDGEFNASARIRIGNAAAADTDPNNSATIVVNGGTLNADRLSLTEKAFASKGTLIVNGGQVNVPNYLHMGQHPAVAEIFLNGGTLSVGELRATDSLVLDISEGTLILEDDQTALIDQLVSSGQLTIDGSSAQRGGLFISYDADAGTTTVTADPSLANPDKAWGSVPAHGLIDVAPETATLSWSAGDATAAAGGHVLYFGTDANAVENGSSGTTLDTAEAAVPEEFLLGQTYYWRVDQIAEDATVTKGSVWSLTVSESLLVDDFEPYDNQDPNRIFDTWKDGHEIDDNGMRVGYFDPNFAETVIVKQGSQSMPLAYDNSGVVVNAEAKRTFASAQDWTLHGIQSLSLMFRGEPGNTFGEVYVKINDTKIAYPLLASHMQFAQWKPWIIDLNDVATDLTNVTSLAIGVDGAGSGTLYIDDIRLYGQEAQLMPASDSGVEPDSSALVAHYLFDGNAEDSSGNGHHGTVLGTASWGDGIFDGALDFSQTTGVDCGDFDPTGGTGKFTVALWCYYAGGPIQHLVTKSAGWGADTMMFQVELKGGDDSTLNLAYAGEDQAGFDRVPAHEWVHLAMTFDGTQATGYLNGIDSFGPKATGIGSNVAASVILGATHKADRILQGLMDDVRIYSYPLTPAEVIGTIGVDLGFKPF
ncbi:MAG: LamG domain-containing protein [Planctomycetes bacterium]|nr:LamG domain-containing protein [Planctomycetota bacterium]